jgi:hypothetical protein
VTTTALTCARVASEPLGSEHSVQEVVNDGKRVAARYVLTAVMAKGQVVPTEIFMFGRLAADGRLELPYN